MDFGSSGSCIIFALSSGPEADKIYGKSGQDSTTPQRLMDIVKENEDLKDKPKVLIFQTLTGATSSATGMCF